MSANNNPDEPGKGPIRGPDGSFVSVPASMPKEHRPDTDGPANHIYRERGDAKQIARKLGGDADVKPVKRNGRVEYHVRRCGASETKPGISVEARTTCTARVEDFAE